jgi:hypothetical protein
LLVDCLVDQAGSNPDCDDWLDAIDDCENTFDDDGAEEFWDDFEYDAEIGCTDSDSDSDSDADWCPGYDGSDECCQTDDPCDWADDGWCDCDDTCAWDSSDCDDDPYSCDGIPSSCTDIGSTTEEQYFGCCWNDVVYWCEDGITVDSIDCGSNDYSCEYDAENDIMDCM